MNMTIPEALLLLGHGHPGMRGKYLSQADRDEIAELIEGLAQDAPLDGQTSMELEADDASD